MRGKGIQQGQEGAQLPLGDAEEAEVTAIAKEEPAVKAALEGKQILKEIFVKGKLLNIVAR